MKTLKDLGAAALFILAAILIVGGSFGCSFLVRQHGISSCEDRGGTPVVRSIFNESMWDVSCIEGTKP